jgi:sec-independent protein translocase protein TatA
MPDVSPIQLVIVLIIALVVLGPKRLPEVGRSLGKGIREFKDSISGHDQDEPAAATPSIEPPASQQTTSYAPPAEQATSRPPE